MVKALPWVAKPPGTAQGSEQDGPREGAAGSAMVDGWLWGFAFNAIIAGTYLGIMAFIAVSIVRSRQWRSNPLATATVFLFLTCGGGHAVYALQLAEPSLGWTTPYAEANRAVYNDDWHLWAWDGVTAAIGVWYLSMRRKFPALVHGAAIFEDLRARQLRALEINDNVVQGLVRAKLALDLGAREESVEAVEGSLASAKRIITELLRGEGESTALKPGGLRRHHAGRG